MGSRWFLNLLLDLVCEPSGRHTIPWGQSPNITPGVAATVRVVYAVAVVSLFLDLLLNHVAYTIQVSPLSSHSYDVIYGKVLKLRIAIELLELDSLAQRYTNDDGARLARTLRKE